MGAGLFLDVEDLRRRPVAFDATFDSDELNLPDNWSADGQPRAVGLAMAVERGDWPAIRVQGRLDGRLRGVCDRCLAPIEFPLGGDFELEFSRDKSAPAAGERSIAGDEAGVGFYEAPGLPLADAVREQILLWLPMRGLCRDDCQGLCPTCGANRNEGSCGCGPRRADPRWEALEEWKLVRRTREPSGETSDAESEA